MQILIAGARGFLGSALKAELLSRGHRVRSLTRSKTGDPDAVEWNGRGPGPWVAVLEQSDAIVNACGFGLEHWPWNRARRQQFHDSRVLPGIALANALAGVERRPRVLIQFSGVNRYGMSGEDSADEATPPADDFLARLTVPWEESTSVVETLGVRRVVVRNGVVLAARRGLFPLMCLPARLHCGGRLGTGRQFVPWIHLADHVRALIELLEDARAEGPYNLVSPDNVTNADFMRAVCEPLHRPYWLHVPGGVMRAVLGEMADLVLQGRPSAPARLLERGSSFSFPEIRAATRDLLGA